jgi:hypothetical protein
VSPRRSFQVYDVSLGQVDAFRPSVSPSTLETKLSSSACQFFQLLLVVLRDHLWSGDWLARAVEAAPFLVRAMPWRVTLSIRPRWHRAVASALVTISIARWSTETTWWPRRLVPFGFVADLPPNSHTKRVWFRIVERWGSSMVSDGSRPELCCFLLIHRGRRTTSALVVEAMSLADALVRAEEIGCDPSLFRLGQQLDPQLAAIVRPDQVNRTLPRAEAKRLLASFSAHLLTASELYRRPTYFAAAE